VEVICHKRPRKTPGFTVGQDTAKPIQKIITVGIIEKNLSSINPPHNDMLQRSWGVYTSFSRHGNQVSNNSTFVNRKFEERPLHPYIRLTVHTARPAILPHP
jgi:hypothetical protein